MSIEATLIAPDQLATLQAAEPVVIIDTRDADTFAAGHIPGAVNLREVFTFLATSTPEACRPSRPPSPTRWARPACPAKKPPCFTKTR
ncbi:Rhodanese-like domain protein [Hydrogenophaga sp. T4]|nr:Rhodanese-like domain protein [Hydrogenophaga sp. T4]